MSDSALLYRWRIEDETADWYESEPISRDEHDQWFAARLRTPAVRIWVVETDNRPIGVIRLDSNDELTVQIDQAWRNIGYGTRAAKWACEHADGRVKANIDAANLPALRAAEKARFALRDDVRFLLWRP